MGKLVFHFSVNLHMFNFILSKIKKIRQRVEDKLLNFSLPWSITHISAA